MKLSVGRIIRHADKPATPYIRERENMRYQELDFYWKRIFELEWMSMEGRCI